MTAAAYVGRVGGLAVALGIGAVVCAGTALADTDSTDTSSHHAHTETSTHGSTSAEARRNTRKELTSAGQQNDSSSARKSAAVTRAKRNEKPVPQKVASRSPGRKAPDVTADVMLTSTALAAAGRETADAPGRVSLAYTPIHATTQEWMHSEIGQQIAGFVNTLAGSYVIGDGADGTAEHPNGGAAGWLLGDGGDGWDSDEPGVAGGAGGAAGLFGNGGAGGVGGAGATGRRDRHLGVGDGIPE